MTDTPQDKPLWRVMDLAAYPTPQPPGHNYRAVEIRTVADWIEQRQVADYAQPLPDVREVLGWLRAEADRAERGERP
jgi:hypothetical protein